jgi:hypothetical protein
VANAKISALPHLPVPVITTDLVCVVDMAELVTKQCTIEEMLQADPNRPSAAQKAALTGSAFGTPPSGENPFVTVEDQRVGGKEWQTVSHGDMTFTANGAGGSWTVTSGNIAYFKWIRLNATTIAIKGAITGSTTSSAGSELRVAFNPVGIVFGTNDSFGFTVWTVDAFTNQDVGQSIGRVSTNALTFKRRDGAAWGSVSGQVGVIWNLIIECSTVPVASEG